MDNLESAFDEIDDDLQIEEDLGSEEVIISIPFDPSKIRVDTKPYSIGQILEDIGDGVIDFETEFQRLPGLWNDQKKSRFIESLLLNLPIPAFFFSEREDNNWEVVDGLQRISTLKQYVLDDDLPLFNLEFLSTYNGSRFSHLPITLQKRITRFAITLNIIEKATPVDVKFNIFKRINQGGLVLTAQEIRHAINQGKPSELIGDLVRGEDTLDSNGGIRVRKNRDGLITILTSTEEGISFCRATGNKIRSTRMEDRDFATRFVAFYLIPYTEYEPDLDSFLNKGMAKIKELTDLQILQLKNDFRKAMNAAYDIFGLDAFRKRYHLDDHRKPINKALFEIFSVTFSKLDESQIRLLTRRREQYINGFIELQNRSDGRFLNSISQGTAQKENVEKRFLEIQYLTESILRNA